MGDGLSFGFNIPIAYWLYPLWGDADERTLNVESLKGKEHSNVGNGFQPFPTWRKESDYVHSDPKESINLKSDQDRIKPGEPQTVTKKELQTAIKLKGLAVTLLNIEYIYKDVQGQLR